MSGYVVSLVGGVLSLVLYARVLGPEDYGRLAVDLALVEAFQGVLFQWHRLAIVRFWAVNEKRDLASYLATYHRVWLGLASASVLILGIALLVVEGSFSLEWSMVLAMGVGKSAALYAQEIARAQGAGALYAMGAGFIALGGAVAGIAAYRLSHSIVAVLAATTVVFIASAVFCGVRVRSIEARGQFESRHFHAMISYGLPLIPVFVAVTALTRLDRPILARFEGPAVVGTYAASSALVTNMIAAACLLIVTPAYPWLLREKERRPEEEYRRLHARVGLLMLGCVGAISIALYSARSVILPAMLGRAIGIPAQAYVLALAAIAVIGAFRAHFFDQAFHLFSRTRALMGINLATLAVALVAVYTGARIGGLNGMIVGLLVANTASLVFSASYARSFVAMPELLRGAGRLVLALALASMLRMFVASSLSTVMFSDVFIDVLATCVAVVTFLLCAYLTNVGGIRMIVSRRI